TIKRVVVLGNPQSATYHANLRSVETVARTDKIAVIAMSASGFGDIQSAFSAMARERIQALIVHTDPVLNAHAKQIAELALKHRIASIAARDQYAELGGLISY